MNKNQFQVAAFLPQHVNRIKNTLVSQFLQENVDLKLDSFVHNCQSARNNNLSCVVVDGDEDKLLFQQAFAEVGLPVLFVNVE